MSEMKNPKDDASASALSVDALANLFETLSLESSDDDASALTLSVEAVVHRSGVSSPENPDDDASALTLAVDAVAHPPGVSSPENPDDDASALTLSVDAVAHPPGVSSPEIPDDDASALTLSVDAVAHPPGVSSPENPDDDASALTLSVDAVANHPGVSTRENPDDDASALTLSVDAVAHPSGVSSPENPDDDASALTPSVDAVAHPSGVSSPKNPDDDASALTLSVDAVAHPSGVSSPENPDDDASALTPSVEAVAHPPGVSSTENPDDDASALTLAVDAVAHPSGVSSPENPDDDASALTPSVDAVAHPSGVSSTESSDDDASVLTPSVDAVAHPPGVSSREHLSPGIDSQGSSAVKAIRKDAHPVRTMVSTVAGSLANFFRGTSVATNGSEDKSQPLTDVNNLDKQATLRQNVSPTTSSLNLGEMNIPKVELLQPLAMRMDVTASSAINSTEKTPRSDGHGDAGCDEEMESCAKVGSNYDSDSTGDVLDADDVNRNATLEPENALPTFSNNTLRKISPDQPLPFGKDFNPGITGGFKGHDLWPPRFDFTTDRRLTAEPHCSSYIGGPENPMLKPIGFPGNGLHSVFGRQPPKLTNQCLSSGTKFVQSTANYLIKEQTSSVKPKVDRVDISMRPFASGVINKYAQGNLLRASNLLTRNGTLKPIDFNPKVLRKDVPSANNLARQDFSTGMINHELRIPRKDPIGSYTKYGGRGNLLGEAKFTGTGKVPIPVPSSGQFGPNDNPNGKYLGAMRDVVPDAPPSTPHDKQKAKNGSKAEPFPSPSSSIAKSQISAAEMVEAENQRAEMAEIVKQKAIIKNQINLSLALSQDRVYGINQMSVNQMMNAAQSSFQNELQTLSRDLGDVYRQVEWQNERNRLITTHMVAQGCGSDAGETSSSPKYIITSEPPMQPYKVGKASTVPTLPKSIDCHRQPNAAHITAIELAKDKKRLAKTSTALQTTKVKPNADMALTSSSSEEKEEKKNCMRKIPSGKDFLRSSVKYLGQENPSHMKPKFAGATDSTYNAPVSKYLMSSSSAEEQADITTMMNLIKKLPSSQDQESQYSSLSTDSGTNQPDTENGQTGTKRVSEISKNCDNTTGNQQKSPKLVFDEKVSEVPTLPKALNDQVEPVAAGSSLDESESTSTVTKSDKRETTTTTKENAVQRAKKRKKTPNLPTKNASEKKDLQKKVNKKGKSKNRRDADYAKRKATLKKELTDSSLKNMINGKPSKQDPDIRLLSLARNVDNDSQSETDSETEQTDVSKITSESNVTKKETQISAKNVALIKPQEQPDKETALSSNIDGKNVDTGKEDVDATETKMKNKRKVMKKHAAQQAKQTTKMITSQKKNASEFTAEKLPGKKMFGNQLSDERIVTPIPPKSPIEPKNPDHGERSKTKDLTKLTPRDSESETIEEEIIKPNNQENVKAAKKLIPKSETSTKAGKTGKPPVTARSKNLKPSKIPRSKTVARSVPVSAKKFGGGAKLAQKKNVNSKPTPNKQKKPSHLPYDFNRIEKILADLKVTNKYTQISLKKVGFVMNLEKNVSFHTLLNSKLKAGTKKLILAKLEIEDDLKNKISKKQTKKVSTKEKSKVEFENAVTEYRFYDDSSINDMHFDEIVKESQCQTIKAKKVWKHAEKRHLQLTNARAILATAYQHHESTKNDKDSSSEKSDEEEPIEEQIEAASTESASSVSAFGETSTESASPRSSHTESVTNDYYEDDFEFCSDEDEEIEEANTYDQEKPLTYFPAMQTATSRPLGNIATRKANKKKVTFAQNIVLGPKLSIPTSLPSTPLTAPPGTSPTVAVTSAMTDGDPVSSTISNAADSSKVFKVDSLSSTSSNTAPLSSTSSAAAPPHVPIFGEEENNKPTLAESHTTPITLTDTKEEMDKMWEDFLPEPPKAPSPPPRSDTPKISSESLTDVKLLPKIAEEEEVDIETARENAEFNKAILALAKVEREEFGVYIALVELKGNERTPEELTMLYDILHDPEKSKVLTTARAEFESTGDAVQAAQPFWKFCSDNPLKPEVVYSTSYTGGKKIATNENKVENAPSMDAAKLQKIEFLRKQQQQYLKKRSKLQTAAACGFYQTNTPRPKTPVTKKRIGKSVEEQKPIEQPKTGDQPKSEEQPKTGDQPKSEEQPKTGDQPKSGEQPKPCKQVECGEQTKTPDDGESDKKPKIETTHDELPKPVKIQIPKKRLTDEPLPPLPTKGLFSCDLMQKKSTRVVASSSKTKVRELPPIPQKKVVSLKALKRVETDKCMSGEKVKNKVSRPKQVSWDLVNKRRNKIAPFNNRPSEKEDLAILDIDEEVPEPQQEVWEEPEVITLKKPWWQKVIAFGKRKLFGCCLSSNDNEIIIVQESQTTEQ